MHLTDTPHNQIVIVADNQSSHKSESTKRFLDQNSIKMMYLPPYSSPLNPIEHVWAAFKTLWRKKMARQFDKFPDSNIERLVTQVMDEVKTTPRLLNSITAAVERVLNDELV